MSGILQTLSDNPLERWAADHDLSFLYPTYVLLALIVLIGVGIIVSFRGSKKRAKGTTHIIAGITNAGKTALYARLYRGSFDKTVSSLQENEAKFPLYGEGDENKEYHIVDYPGHLEVKNKLMETYIPKAKSIVFMVDSVSFPTQVGEVANYLYSLLMDKVINDAEIPILVACNKADMLTAIPPEEIRQKLEKELNQIRETRTAMPGIQGQNADDEEEFYLGYENQAFEFVHLPFEVEFVACSVKDNSLEGITSFLSRN